MARRRRYDTEALVGQLRAERRTGILLTMAGVGILLLLIILYVTGMGGDEEIPEVPTSPGFKAAQERPEDPPPGPEGETPEEPAEGDDAGAAEEEPEPEEEEEEAEPEEPAGPAKVSLQLSKKGVVWLGKKKLGKFKKKSIELPPGKHLLRAKVGRKKIKTTVTIEGGEQLSLYFDHKKRKVTVKKK